MAESPASEKSIFLEALEKTSAAERALFLDRACQDDPQLRAKVEALLQAHQEPQALLDVAEAAAATLDRPANPEGPGTVIGPYKLLQQIGEGGMGTVWMAQQTEPVKRLVAVKLIKAGMDSKQFIARFEAERQALALMDHANIARVLDGGTTKGEPGGVSPGRPYFVMDLVKGVPITKYSDEHHLTPRQRLELFIPVCQAIQHAHQKGIIHRDLKPSNVVVALYDGKPVPKVIDFGVAKAAGQTLTDKTLVTGFGAIIGTLEYMSPEQAEINQLDIDTRSDIYSLGVLLYELLTGSTPFNRRKLEQAGMLEMLRVIREEEPSKPSTKLSTAEGLPTLAANRGTEPAKLTKLLRGELDWIVMKALEKDRNRRYETTNSLARDIERYLHDEPVQACPPSTMYRFRKFARRNKGPVLAATVIVILLLGGIIGTTIGLLQARAERDEKDKARQQAEANLHMAREAVDHYFTLVSESKLFDTAGSQPLRKELLEAALAYYERFAREQGDDPSLQGEMAVTYFRLWQIYLAVDRFSDAMAALRKGVELAENLYRHHPEDTELYRRLAGFRKGGLYFHRSYEFNSDPRPDIETLERAARFWETLTREHPGISDFPLNLAETYSDIAYIVFVVEPPAQELATYQKAYTIWEKLALENPTSLEYQEHLARAQVRLGWYLTQVGRFQEAEKAIQQGLDFAESMAARSPRQHRYRESVAEACHRLFRLHARASQYEKAEKAFCRGSDCLQRLAVEFPNTPAYPELLSNMELWRVRMFLGAGRLQDAEKVARHRIALCEKLVADFPGKGGNDYWLADASHELGRILNTDGRGREAIPAFRRAVPLFEQSVLRYPIDPLYRPQLANGYLDLIQALEANGEVREAQDMARQASAYYDKLAALYPKGPDYDHYVADAHRVMGKAFWKAKMTPEAEKFFRQAVAIHQKLVAEYPDNGSYRRALAAANADFAAFQKEPGNE